MPSIRTALRCLALSSLCASPVLASPADDPVESVFIAVAQVERARSTTDEIGALLDELRSSDAVAREQACERLIASGAASEIYVALDRLPPGPATVAARRAFSAITGVSPETAKSVDDRLRASGDRATTALEDAVFVLGCGDAATAYALGWTDQPQSIREVQRSLRALQAVKNLAGGENKGDAAAKALAELGADGHVELGAIAGSAVVEPHWRTIAAERMLFLGGDAAMASAIDLVRKGDAELRAVCVPTMAASAPVAQFSGFAAALAPWIDREPDLVASLAAFAERLPDAQLRASVRADVPAVRMLAAKGLGARRVKDARDDLRPLLHDRDVAVVESAVWALGKLADQDDLPRLRDFLFDPRPRLRRAAVEAVASLDQELALGWVTCALKDADASVRVRAACCLAETGKNAAVEPLIAALSDENASVLAAATSALARLTKESVSTIGTASSLDQRRAARDAWESWYRRKHDQDGTDKAKTDAKPAAGEAAKDPASPLAADGGRILRQLGDTLQSEFRPYGKLKERKPTDAQSLLKAAVDSMLEVLDREKDAKEPDLATLDLSPERRAVLRHLLQHGEFKDLDDLGRMVGALPIELQARDYMLLIYEAAQAVVRSVGDRFTRLSLLLKASGEVDERQLPGLFGKQETNGVMVEVADAGARIEFVFAGTPAHRAGLRPGDRILSINGEPTAAMKYAQAARRLNKTCDLMVLRDGWTNPVAFHLVPEVENPDEVVTTAMLPGKIGYLRLRGFEIGCAQQVEWGLRKLEEQGMVALVFDLRNNPGGTVLDACSIVDKFVPKGKTIQTSWFNSGKEGEDHREEKVESSDSDNDRNYPLAVLVNKCSASASEMTSGSLQDLERAVIVGRKSWGKGIGQSGAGAIAGFTRKSVLGEATSTLSLTITVLEYFLPTGRSIQGVGVEPDVAVIEPQLLGERYELMQRVKNDPATAEYVAKLLADHKDQALELARFDGWETSRWPGFDELRAKLDVELNAQLVRTALREALRAAAGATDKTLLTADVEDDEDVRAAVGALAPKCGLDLASLPEYSDLSN